MKQQTVDRVRTPDDSRAFVLVHGGKKEQTVERKPSQNSLRMLKNNMDFVYRVLSQNDKIVLIEIDCDDVVSDSQPAFKRNSYPADTPLPPLPPNASQESETHDIFDETEEIMPEESLGIQQPVASQTIMETPTTSRNRDSLLSLPKEVLYSKKYTAKRAGGPPKDSNGRMLPPLVPLPPAASSIVNRTIAKQDNRPPQIVGGKKKASLPLPFVGGQKKSSQPLPYVGGTSSKRKSSDPVRKGPVLKRAVVTKAIPSDVLRHIQAKQEVGNVIPRAHMLSLVKEISNNVSKDINGPNYKWQSAAVDAIQEAAEAYITELFEDANLVAAHVKRVTITGKDIQLIQLLRRGPFRPIPPSV